MLTRLYTQDIYGAWLQILIISEILKQLLGLRLGTALVRYLPGEGKPHQVIKAVMTITVMCSLTFVATVWVFQDELSGLIFGNHIFQSILVISSFWILVQACMRVGLSVLRSQEKISTLSVREFLSAVWLVLSVFLAYRLSLGLETLMLICLTGDTILLIWILIQIGVPVPFISPKEAIAIIRKFLPYSAPLIFNTLFLWLTRSIDRFLIVQMLGLSLVSIYGVAFQLASLLFIVLRPINFVLFPRVSSAWTKGDKNDVSRYFSQSLTLTLILSTPLLIGILSTSEGLIRLLAGEKYISEQGLILCLLVACLASMVYQNHLYVVHLVEKTFLLPFLFVSTSIINLIIGYFLILKTGLIGAAISRAFTLGFMALVVTIWARRHIKFHINWSLVLRVGLASLIMGLALKWISMDSWESLFIKILTGSVIFVLSLVPLRVLTRTNLMMLKNQFQ
jgi:O-antigen/teichoic acid export membrane protein